jgi:hypothetical protein
MALRRTDDLDGSLPAEQVTFGLEGTAYVIDLGEAGRARLQQALQRFLTVATPYGELPLLPVSLLPAEADAPDSPAAARGGRAAPAAPRRSPAKAAPESVEVSQKLARAWANQSGYSVNAKGRVPDAIMKAYIEAHADD